RMTPTLSVAGIQDSCTPVVLTSARSPSTRLGGGGSGARGMGEIWGGDQGGLEPGGAPNRRRLVREAPPVPDAVRWCGGVVRGLGVRRRLDGALGRDAGLGRLVPDVEQRPRHALRLAEIDNLEIGGPVDEQRQPGAEFAAGPRPPQPQRRAAAGIVTAVQLRRADRTEVALVVLEIALQVNLAL